MMSNDRSQYGWWSGLSFWYKIAVVKGVVILALLVLAVLFRGLFVNFIDNYELGYKYDLRSGKIEVLERTGYVVTPPLVVKVHTVDLRPMQVCINANQRVLNCKLVQFNKAGLELFLSWHGRNDYEGPGNSGGGTVGSGTTAFSEILKSYAYDGSSRIYPFLTIIRELKPEEIKP
jgi:hypothetical protein